jgi:RNA polymerase-binding protein DksA
VTKIAAKTSPKAMAAKATAGKATAKIAATAAISVKTATKAPAKTAPKATATKATSSKAPAKTAPKATATKATASKAPERPARKAIATKPTATKATAAKVPSTGSGARPQHLRVRANEKPWTAKELTAVRAGLEADMGRLQQEISAAELDLAGLMRDAGDGAGDDQADAGTATFEREQEISLANNAREMFEQSGRALARIADGSYGVCESCGSPIGKNRLLAFPRATLCLTCKSKQERR